jgi:hypothetical protein
MTKRCSFGEQVAGAGVKNWGHPLARDPSSKVQVQGVIQVKALYRVPDGCKEAGRFTKAGNSGAKSR